LILGVTIQLKFSTTAQSQYGKTVAGEWSQTNNPGRSSYWEGWDFRLP